MASIKDVAAMVATEEELVDITIYDLKGDPYTGLDGEPSTIGVYGSESKRYREEESKVAHQIVDAVRMGREVDPDEARVRKAVAAVGRWSGWDDGEKDLPLTPENVRGVLEHQHILTQVEAGIRKHARFFERASRK